MFDDGTPIYRQIAEQIKRDVLIGTLAAEDQVMSTNEYAAFYRINPATAARAFAELVDEGVLYKRRGIGMFVTPDARERLIHTHRERFMAEVVDPMVAEAAVIGISIPEILARIHELDRASGPRDTAHPDPTRQVETTGDAAGGPDTTAAKDARPPTDVT